MCVCCLSLQLYRHTLGTFCHIAGISFWVPSMGYFIWRRRTAAAGRAAVSAVTKEFFFSKTETSTDEMYPLKGSQSPFLDKSTFERTTIYVRTSEGR